MKSNIYSQVCQCIFVNNCFFSASFFLFYYYRFLVIARITYVYYVPWELDAPLPLLSDSYITLPMPWPSSPLLQTLSRQHSPLTTVVAVQTPWELSWFPLELFLISPQPFLLHRNESLGDKIKNTRMQKEKEKKIGVGKRAPGICKAEPSTRARTKYTRSSDKDGDKEKPGSVTAC